MAEFSPLTLAAAKEAAAAMLSARGLSARASDTPTTPGEGDFCPCGGSFVPRRDGHLGRYCGACLTPEPVPLLYVRMPDGQMQWLSLYELAEQYD